MLHIRTAAMAAIATVALSACVVAPYPARGYGYGYAGGGEVIYADSAPPAPYAEVVPALPYAGAVWLGGYWGWSGGRHSWVPGRWERSRPGYAWSPHRWVPEGNRWRLTGGGWVRH